MKVAITGASGFVGRHLAQRLSQSGYELSLIARGVDQRSGSMHHLARATHLQGSVTSLRQLQEAFRGADVVVHCAGINCERGEQTYQAVHVDGTRKVVEAAKREGVKKVVLLSFLKARPDCGSAYHESKWEAEEIVRASGLDYTIMKAGMIYGLGDHMLDHLTHLLHTMPLFAKVGMLEKPIRPIAIQDLLDVMETAVVTSDLKKRTYTVLGPETLMLSEAVKRVATLVNRKAVVFPAPVVMHQAMAYVLERVMKISLIAQAQVTMLAEGMDQGLPGVEELPEHLQPKLPFTGGHLIQGIPERKPFGLRDLKCGCCKFQMLRKRSTSPS